MTYILGSVCKDGIVLVGDRKLSGAAYPWEDKIFMDIPNMVVGSSGVYSLFDKFRTKVTYYIRAHLGQRLPVPEFLENIEDFTAELNKKYAERTRGSIFDVLVAARTNEGVFLQHILPVGLAEPVKTYGVIGHGEPYGAAFLKMLWQPNMTMEQVAELGYFIIKQIEQNALDDSVGIGEGHAQIWYVPSELQKPIEQAKPEALERLGKRVDERLNEYKQGVKQLFVDGPR